MTAEPGALGRSLCALANHEGAIERIFFHREKFLNERLPTVFMPVSPPPYANGPAREFLSWV